MHARASPSGRQPRECPQTHPSLLLRADMAAAAPLPPAQVTGHPSSPGHRPPCHANACPSMPDAMPGQRAGSVEFAVAAPLPTLVAPSGPTINCDRPWPGPAQHSAAQRPAAALPFACLGGRAGAAAASAAAAAAATAAAARVEPRDPLPAGGLAGGLATTSAGCTPTAALAASTTPASSSSSRPASARPS
jgi:hypothetical protein